MAQKPPKDQITKPVEADRTLRLSRKDLGLEKDEPPQALQMGVPAAAPTLRLKRDDMPLKEPTVVLKASVPDAGSTLRLKRDDMPFEEPTVALKASAPESDHTVRLKRDEMSFEETTPAIERPKLRTAMEVIDEATQVETPKVKPSVMMPDGMDIPSWEETTKFFTQPPGGHTEPTVQVPRPLEPPPAPMDPSDSMDETFSNVSMPVLPQTQVPSPPEATTLMLVLDISETEEDTLVLPDMHELDELPNAMKSTLVMRVMEAPAAPQEPEPMEATTILHVEPPYAPMGKTLVMQVMQATAAPQEPEPMEATTIMHHMEPPSAPMGKTLVLPVMQAPVAPQEPEPMEATTIMHHMEPPSAPMGKTLVMPVMQAPVAPQEPKPMDATTIMPISIEDPSAYLTRQGQSPWLPSTESPESSPGFTQLMSESLLSKAMEATKINADSALAPVPPEVSAMEGDSPLTKATDIPASPHPMYPLSPVSNRTVDTSTGMAVTPPTMLMHIQPPLDSTVLVKRSAFDPTQSATPVPNAPQPISRSSQPMHSRPESEPMEPKVAEPKAKATFAPPSVSGYVDRQVPQLPETKYQTKPFANPARPISPARIPMAPQAIPADISSKIWVPVAIGVLLLVIGGIYFAFFRTSLKTNSPLVTLPIQTAEPSLPVPPKMQGDLAKARAGDAKAMHMLGVSFFYGLDVRQNKAEGLRWMRKAAEAGNEKAKSDLRQMESGGR